MAEQKKGGNNTWIIVVGVLIGLFLVTVVLTLIFAFSTGATKLSIGDIAVIKINGFLTGSESGGFGSGTTASAQEIIDFIETAEKNPSIRAILLDINTPGGEAYAGAVIGDALKKVTKPKVALIRSLGASGGYWIALHTDYIISHRYSITGSVGVISSYPEFDEFLEEYNVSYNRLVSGEYKDLGDPFINLTEEKRNILQKQLDSIHEDFINLVRQNRPVTEEQLDTIKTGRFFLGSEAYGLNLVDELGSDDEAEEYFKNQLNITNPSYIYYEKDVGIFDFFRTEMKKLALNVGEGLGSSLVDNQNYKPTI